MSQKKNKLSPTNGDLRDEIQNQTCELKTMHQELLAEVRSLREDLDRTQNQVKKIQNESQDLKTQLNHALSKIDHLEAELVDLRRSVKEEILLELDSIIAEKTMYANNLAEQRDRDSNIQVHGLQFPNTATSQNKKCEFIFQKVLKPILEQAKDFPVPDKWNEVIGIGHDLQTRKNAASVFHLKLRAKNFAEMILKNKRSLRNTEAGKNVFVNKDLTAINRKKLTEMKNHPLVHGAWFINNSRCRIILKGNNKIMTMKPHQTLEEIIDKNA